MSDKFENFNNFIERAKNIHNGFYSYDNVDYINARKDVTITCPIHGDFNQRPDNHLSGKGCNKCSIDRNKRQFTKRLEDFITQSVSIHNNKYDYSKVEYNDTMSKVEIICPIHGSK